MGNKYYGEGAITTVWDEYGKLIANYTGEHRFDARVLKGYYNPRLSGHPLRRGHCIGFGFCKELIISQNKTK
jgi:hypothetical protein